MGTKLDDRRHEPNRPKTSWRLLNMPALAFLAATIFASVSSAHESHITDFRVTSHMNAKFRVSEPGRMLPSSTCLLIIAMASFSQHQFSSICDGASTKSARVHEYTSVRNDTSTIRV